MNDTTQKPDGIVWCKVYGRRLLDTIITFKGITKTLPQWAREFNTTKKNLDCRLRTMPFEHAMTPHLDNARRSESIRKAVAAKRDKDTGNLDYWFDFFNFGRYKHEKQNIA